MRSGIYEMNRYLKKMSLAAMLSVSMAMLLAGCASVNKTHPRLMPDDISAEQISSVATVYVIRPRLLKSKGVADLPVRIDYQGQPLLTLEEGSYALMYIRPGKGEIKVWSKTRFTNQMDSIDVWRSRQYKFIVGKTYFIHIRQVDEEFRGVFYEPELVNLKQAKVLVESARASGVARRAPIEKLTAVDEPPASATIALPLGKSENASRRKNIRVK